MKQKKQPMPGQVYWNPKQQRLAVVYAVYDNKPANVPYSRVKAVGIGMTPSTRGSIHRFNWPNGIPSTWTLYEDVP